MVTFTGTLQTGGGNATGVVVPEEVWRQLTSARRAAVTVLLAGHGYRSTIGWYKGAYMLPVSAANRASAGVVAGDTVEITLELDSAPREVELPADLSAAIASESGAQAAWDRLAPGKKKAQVTAIEQAKTDATRENRIAKVVHDLVEGP